MKRLLTFPIMHLFIVSCSVSSWGQAPQGGDEIFVEPTRIIHQWSGEAEGDQFGWTARKAGDVDGDGLIDFIATAPTHNKGAGKIYLFSSGTGKLIHSVKGKPGYQLGNSAVGIGDVNGDGVPDFAAGAPSANSVGRAFVYSGKDATIIHEFAGKTQGEQFGYEVSELGDIDGDDCPDLFVGAMSGNGSTKKCGRGIAYSGKTGTPLFELFGEKPGDGFGNAAASIQIPNSKSAENEFLLAIGAKNAGPSNRGCVYVYRIKNAKPKLQFKIEGDTNSVNLGQMFISFPGDLDRDGIPDVFVSDFSDNTKVKGGGKVSVHSGSDGKELLAIHGRHRGEGLGTSPSDAGDVDGDGIGDLVIGAWQNREGAPSGGRVYLYSSAEKGKLLRTWTSKQAGDTLGFDATGIGDVDGDGHLDFLLTSAWSKHLGPKTGKVFIVAGEPTADEKKRDFGKQSGRSKPSRRRIGNLSQSRIEAADYSALFIGNSHTWNLDEILTKMFAEQHPEKKVCFARAPGIGFLVDHARSSKTRDLIQLGQWDYVILQAQKYSTSGRYKYSHDGAKELSKLAKEGGSRIIMFPEWSQRGKRDEYHRIDKLHHEIAKQTGAAVAPIGACWDSVLESNSDIVLHAGDGNHASNLGAYLNACVFYSMISGEKAPVFKRVPNASGLDKISVAAWAHVRSMANKKDQSNAK